MKKNLLRLKRKKRTRKSIIGTSEKPRISVFRSLKHIYVQAIDDKKGVTIAASSDLKITSKGKSKKELARLVGEEFGKKLSAKKIKNAVFDRSFYKYHGRVKELAEGIKSAKILF